MGSGMAGVSGWLPSARLPRSFRGAFADTWVPTWIPTKKCKLTRVPNNL